MTDMLKYDELIKGRKTGEYKRVPLKFDRICPRLSGTLAAQANNMIPGLTLVTFFDKATVERFNSILDRIDINHKIHRTKQLHCTLLGLLSNTNPYYDELVKKEIIKFFKGRSHYLWVNIVSLCPTCDKLIRILTLEI